MAPEYKKRGGGYNTDKKDQDECQKHLSQWTEEEGRPRKEIDEKKLGESKEGKQFVQNTRRAKSARQKANQGKEYEIEARKAEGTEQEK